MTDVLAALAVLVDIDCPERGDGAGRASIGAGPTTRWSSTNGSHCRPARRCPARSRRCATLTTHPAFTRANPNRVRALVGAFSQANPVHFHAASGEGYAFLADEVLALDPANPTTAARLVQPLGNGGATMRRGRG